MWILTTDRTYRFKISFTFAGKYFCVNPYRPRRSVHLSNRGRVTSKWKGFFLAQQSVVGRGLLAIESHNHTKTHHTRWVSSGRVTSRGQRPLTTQTLFRRQISVLAGGIQTQSRQTSGRSFIPQPARPLGWAKQTYIDCKWQCIYICIYEPPKSKPKILL